MKKETERRVMPAAEMRVKRDDDDGIRIAGYAIVYDKQSDDIGFREFVRPGACKRALEKSDVRALINHDPSLIVGRTGVNLTLKEDKTGLFMELAEPPTGSARFNQLVADIESGLITQQSFGFTVRTDTWTEDKKTGTITREIQELEELFDVSPVTFPAYQDTTVALRSLETYKSSVNAGNIDVNVENEDMDIDLLISKYGGTSNDT